MVDEHTQRALKAHGGVRETGRGTRTPPTSSGRSSLFRAADGRVTFQRTVVVQDRQRPAQVDGIRTAMIRRRWTLAVVLADYELNLGYASHTSETLLTLAQPNLARAILKDFGKL